MVVINSRTRYRATSEQQKKLQRNISLQAEAARIQRDRIEAEQRNKKLEQLTRLEMVLNPQRINSFIAWCFDTVARAEVNAGALDLTGEYDRLADRVRLRSSLQRAVMRFLRPSDAIPDGLRSSRSGDVDLTVGH
jgi:hypothetical protein